MALRRRKQPTALHLLHPYLTLHIKCFSKYDMTHRGISGIRQMSVYLNLSENFAEYFSSKMSSNKTFQSEVDPQHHRFLHHKGTVRFFKLLVTRRHFILATR